ncbi:hypothetical protein M9M90_01145 [Phenylobacterium sp. LH3H17]|uniref:STM4504/CBY_0614 family protein n=1 Tax=Phenylobacterium sp. LH3H17 TaxID=2903901 RepID=UPI0020CA09A0|nr:hypothetical protein [Phenylobacterium sp. LH3H17]UTP39810.1 hypothetical protein M9M90_01145 [Phenylobacterium sp. LH3H17]
MPPFKTFKQRKLEAERAGMGEVYKYDALSQKLRNQLGQIFADAIGEYSNREYQVENNSYWDAVHKHLCKVEGRDFLTDQNFDAKDDIIYYIRTCQDVDDALSAIEMCCRMIDLIGRSVPTYEYSEKGIVQNADDALAEVNYWFREAAVGYQFESGHVIRVDSQMTHAEIVKPALILLSDKRFAGPEQEYLQAHNHYRSGQYKDAIVWANKAFESTMKAACDICHWPYPAGARASDLLKVLRANKLWPDYLDTSFDQLAATLASGLPKVRNEEGGHGDGAEPRQTPGYIAAYALHLAAAKILLIAEAALSKR